MCPEVLINILYTSLWFNFVVEHMWLFVSHKNLQSIWWLHKKHQRFGDNCCVFFLHTFVYTFGTRFQAMHFFKWRNSWIWSHKFNIQVGKQSFFGQIKNLVPVDLEMVILHKFLETQIVCKTKCNIWLEKYEVSLHVPQLLTHESEPGETVKSFVIKKKLFFSSKQSNWENIISQKLELISNQAKCTVYWAYNGWILWNRNLLEKCWKLINGQVTICADLLIIISQWYVL